MEEEISIFLSSCPTQEVASSPNLGLRLLTSILLNTFTHPRFEDGHIILKTH